MKCPFCGAWSQVLETRNGTRRTRKCANEHRFPTIEIVVSKTALIVKGRRTEAALRYRNRQIKAAIDAGATVAEAAKRFGVSRWTVARMLRVSTKEKET